MTDEGKGPLPSVLRREGGARRGASRRIKIRVSEHEVVGWTLNVSRGGVRVVLAEDTDAAAIDEGLECEVAVDGDELGYRPAQVIWVRTESDGQIAGIKYLDVEGSAPPPVSPPAAADPSK